MRILIIAVALLSLAACDRSRTASDAAQERTLALADALPTEQFVQLVANLNQFQVEASALAQERARRAEVKAFAGAVGVAHEAKQNELAGAAERMGLHVAPTLSPDQEQRLALLRGASPDGFEALYLDQQIEAEETWSNLFDDYLASAAGTPVRTWAERTRSRFRNRLERARALEQSQG